MGQIDCNTKLERTESLTFQINLLMESSLNPHSLQTSAPSTPNKAANFTIILVKEKEREKFLTTKYGAHQMNSVVAKDDLNKDGYSHIKLRV